MMGAHSRPPNHTGDHGHHNDKQDETITRPSSAPPPQDGTDARQEMQTQPATLSLGQQARCPTQPRCTQ
ncbi:hypothetical protein E2C01_101261 [Portunus trituberculatus]|uniref:Uncharacterized protein n=1 Tax=Portunus trituberculatus TaxID=210409 RepID=A0A5B7KFD5_PORTR|nr:hypothetical protein [Portunus trituberculatus]